ncbi:MAG TPA: phage holin family protein [Lachnospiraceae bacterium]|nr:phage holin family protein [Lachnospiraceae bacterium]
MNTIIDCCKIFLLFISKISVWLFDGFDSLIYALIAFVAIDYITGILLAIQRRALSSQIGFKGISKKILLFMVVSMGNIIDKYILGTGSTLRTLVIMFYLANEGISILENAGLMGLPIPEKLKNVIQQLNNYNNNNSNNDSSNNNDNNNNNKK